jgi:hypothetical protein
MNMTEPLEIESPQANINRARFAGKDFFTFIDDLIARIQLNFVTEFNDFVSSGTGQMLIDIVSWACETLSFYIDRQAAESYIQTARLRRSLVRLCRQIGYKMSPAVSASVDLEVTLTEIRAFNVTVPIGFKFTGPNSLIYEATEAVTFPAGEGPLSTPRTIATSEGITRVEKFKSDGSKNQTFRLNPADGKWVAEGTVSLTAAGAPWAESVFITYDPTDQYEVDYNLTPPVARFGDAVAGNIPATGADIVITYVETSGGDGLVLRGTITGVESPLVVAFTDIGLNITNPDPSGGGAPPESLESARRNAPLYFAARNVAVVRADYVSLSQAYTDPVAGSVAVAQAFVALGAEDDLTLQELLNNIRAIVNPLAAQIQGYVDDARDDLSDISDLRDNAEAENTNVGTALVDIGTASATAKLRTEDAQGESIKIEGDVAAALAVVAAWPAGATRIEDPELTVINEYLNDINTKAGNAKGHGDSALNELIDIDNSTSDGDTAQVQIASDLTTMSTYITSLGGELDNIEAGIGTGFETSIETELQAIYDHVDGFLSSDCKSNLVQVPILAYDVDGFYTAPPLALMRSLESYLRARKEVTQSVEVVSGAPYLVGAVITGTIGIVEGYVQATVLSNVRKAIEDLLRGRVFGDSLRKSDLYTSIQPDPKTGVGGIAGVNYANLEITGPAAFLNANGNLVISREYVVTLGLLTLTAETAVD